MRKTIKRQIAEQQVKLHRKKRDKHERAMKKSALARNKELRKAKEATEEAEALEARRLASEKKAKAIARLSAEKKVKRVQRTRKAKRFIKDTTKSFRSLQKSLKKIK